jgi:hypothetical protein
MNHFDLFVLLCAAGAAGGYLIGQALLWLKRRLEWLQTLPRQPRRGGAQSGAFGWTAATWMAISAGVSATAAVASTVQSADASRRQAHTAVDAAKVNAQQADEANNRANAKSPDSAAMMASNALAGKAGQSSTMLTGPSGIDPNSLLLGKNTPLGS